MEGEAYPTGLILEVASLVSDAVLMVTAVEKLDLSHNVRPLLLGLLPRKVHFLHRNDLTCDTVSSVVHGAETPVADLSLVDEDGLRVIVKDVLGQLRVLTDDNFRSLPSYRHGWLAMNSRYFSRGEETGLRTKRRPRSVGGGEVGGGG
jgi:hypothetical protein